MKIRNTNGYIHYAIITSFSQKMNLFQQVCIEKARETEESFGSFNLTECHNGFSERLNVPS